MEAYYLIDYENVGNQGLTGCGKMKSTDHIIIFFTSNVNKIDMSIIANHGLAEIKMIEIPAGKQSADMHISSYLGYLSNNKNYSIIIISNDKDYDNVIKFWKKEFGIQISKKKQISENNKINTPNIIDNNEAKIRSIFGQKFNKKPYNEKKEAIIKALLTAHDKEQLNTVLTKIIPSSHIPPIYSEFKTLLSSLPSTSKKKKQSVKASKSKRENQIKSAYGQHFKNGIYKEKRDEIINILVNSTTKQQINNQLCKIIPTKNASEILKQLKSILKELP